MSSQESDLGPCLPVFQGGMEVAGNAWEVAGGGVRVSVNEGTPKDWNVGSAVQGVGPHVVEGVESSQGVSHLTVASRIVGSSESPDGASQLSVSDNAAAPYCGDFQPEDNRASSSFNHHPTTRLPFAISESPLFEPEERMPGTIPNDMSMLDGEHEVQPETESTPSPIPTTSVTDLKRARALKTALGKDFPILHPKAVSRGRAVEDDPDNQLIKELRQDHLMGWDAIVVYMNKRRLEEGGAATWTTSAVYSRFVRNAPRIAAAKGEIGFDPKDYMHLRNPAQHPSESGPRKNNSNNGSGYVFGAGGGRKRVRTAAKAAEELRENIRQPIAPTLPEQARLLEPALATEQLMTAVSKVKDSFWDHVVNEMHKTTGQLFDPRALESRFRTL